MFQKKKQEKDAGSGAGIGRDASSDSDSDAADAGASDEEGRATPARRKHRKYRDDALDLEPPPSKYANAEWFR